MKNTVNVLARQLEGSRKMNRFAWNFNLVTRLVVVFLTAVSFAGFSPASRAQEPAQSSYSTPEEAMQALVSAVHAKDRVALDAIFGPDHEKLTSGDDVEDNNDLNEFAEALSQSVQLQKAGDTKYILMVGNNNYPMPIPIVQKQGKWVFDTMAGLEEVLDRRIGENELSAIDTCRAYAIAQWEYFTQADWDNDGVAEYAQRFYSSPGERNGLYWETAEGEKPSPLGALVAAARAEGYGSKPLRAPRSAKAANPIAETVSNTQPPPPPRAPYHGYYFKILKSQGPHAPGGKYSYIINGNMIAGYALLAFPEKWGNSGVMTFIINQQGRVYQKNLGPDTLRLAPAITEYDPDSSWKLVEAAP